MIFYSTYNGTFLYVELKKRSANAIFCMPFHVTNEKETITMAAKYPLIQIMTIYLCILINMVPWYLWGT